MDVLKEMGALLTPLKIIPVPDGDVMHALKSQDLGFSGFGEAYFSTVHPQKVKGWKRHRQMTLNLVVPVGEIKFVLFDDRPDQTTHGQFAEVILSQNNYHRLTVPPGLWMGFQGVGEGFNLLLNIASIPHDPTEADRCDLSEITYTW